MAVTMLGYPATSDRGRGSLRYMYRKATTEDNWDKDLTAQFHRLVSQRPT